MALLLAGGTVPYDKLSYYDDAQSYSSLGDRSLTPPPLANAELAIMDLLWDEQSLTAREIRERLYPDSRKAQHGTVQRLLQRLEEKGYVRRDTRLAVHLFSATVGREEYAGYQLETLAKRLTHGSLAPLVTHLIEQNRISPEELERLRRILDEEPGHPRGSR